jgi:hypothetical protein
MAIPSRGCTRNWKACERRINNGVLLVHYVAAPAFLFLSAMITVAADLPPKRPDLNRVFDQVAWHPLTKSLLYFTGELTAPATPPRGARGTSARPTPTILWLLISAGSEFRPSFAGELRAEQPGRTGPWDRAQSTTWVDISSTRICCCCWPGTFANCWGHQRTFTARKAD